MDIKGFLDLVCSEIKYKPVREGISEELRIHVEEIKEEYESKGMDSKVAEEKAVSQMGEAEEIGKRLNKIHRPKLDWKLLLILVVLLGFGFLVEVIRTNSNIIKYFGFMLVRNYFKHRNIFYKL